jgi:hypothetical protein
VLVAIVSERKCFWRVVCVDSEESIERICETLDLFDS